VPLDALPDDSYRYDRASHTLSGRRPGQSFRLGDRVRVAVARVDLERRTLDFRLLGFGRRSRTPPPPRRGKPSKPKGRGKKAAAKQTRHRKHRGR
jgi:ribonuclease R